MKPNVLIMLAISLLTISIGALILPGCGNPTGGGGTASHTWIYCGNSSDHTISIINGSTNTGSIETPGEPLKMTATPEGKTLYCFIKDSNYILMISTVSNEIIGSIETPSAAAIDDTPVISPDDTFLYFTSWADDALYKVYLKNGNTVEAMAIPALKSRRMIINSDGTRVYMLTASGTSLEVGYLQTGTWESHYMGHAAVDLAIKGGRVYVPILSSTGGAPGTVEVFDLNGDYITEILTTDAADFRGICAIPGKDRLYVSDLWGNNLRVIDSSIPAFINSIIITNSSFYKPEFMASTLDGKYVCVYDAPPLQHTKVGVVDTDSNTIIQYINIGNSGVAYNNPVIIYK